MHGCIEVDERGHDHVATADTGDARDQPADGAERAGEQEPGPGSVRGGLPTGEHYEGDEQEKGTDEAPEHQGRQLGGERSGQKTAYY